jgi:hypothetical protein
MNINLILNRLTQERPQAYFSGTFLKDCSSENGKEPVHQNRGSA